MILRPKAPPPRPAPPLAPPPAPLAVGSPAPPQRPPPPPAPETDDLPNFPGGFLFGINYRLDIEGQQVCGRYIAAKKLLQRSGEHTPLPEVFHYGGRRRPAVGGKGKRKTGKVWGWRDERIHSVMGLVLMHDGAL